MGPGLVDNGTGTGRQWNRDWYTMGPGLVHNETGTGTQWVRDWYTIGTGLVHNGSGTGTQWDRAEEIGRHPFTYFVQPLFLFT